MSKKQTTPRDVVASEDQPPYEVRPVPPPTNRDVAIAHAIFILEARLKSRRDSADPVLDGFKTAADYCRLKFAAAEREMFSCLFMDTWYRLIKCETIAMGTIDSTTIHPREVVKAALACNAVVVLLVHNHPSGITDPSDADQAITRRLQEALRLVDVRVLDHFIVGEGPTTSMAALKMI
jgi:DNA repair protein RadC